MNQFGGFARVLLVAFVLGTSTPAFSQSLCDSMFASQSSNPVLALVRAPDVPIRFSELTDAAINNAYPEALALAQQRIARLRTDPRRPDFQNTIEELMRADDELESVHSILTSLVSMSMTPARKQIKDAWRDDIQKFSTEVAFDSVIFDRIKSVYERRDSLRLSREQMTILVDMYQGFAKYGATLNAAQKARVQEINIRLGELTTNFGENNREATEAAFVRVENEGRLEGLPKDVIAAAKEEAERQNEPNQWLISVKLVSPVLDFAKDRNLREEMWKKYVHLSNGGQFDNRVNAIEIVKLNQEKAQIFGYASFAHMTTESRMAKNPETVLKFIENLRVTYKPAADKEARELFEFAVKDGYKPNQGEPTGLRPWDTGFYAERLQKSLFDFDSEVLRPYLPLEAVHQGALRAAERLYGIQFIEIKNADAWHPDVRVYEVREAKNQKPVGFFYFDPVTRNGKRSGAWMTTFRDGGEWAGQKRLPHVVNVMNFAPPTKDQPTLLSIDDVRTVFHELGHALHGLLTKTRYRSKSGPNVAWDFVELPSQLNEEWGRDPATLRSFARHYQTGEPMPLDYIEKLRRADNFLVASSGMRGLLYAAVDMAWYTGRWSHIKSPEEIEDAEKALVANFSSAPWVGRLITPGFNHIFAGGYSAGYYSYKWADAIVADAFEYFQANGIYNRRIANRYRSHILSKGGSEEAAVLYRRFRGQEPDPGALLRREGFGDQLK